MTLSSIIDKFASGAPLDEDERETITLAIKAQLAGKVASGMSADEQTKLLAGADKYKNTPGMQAYWKSMAQARNADRFVTRNKPFFQAMLNGVDIATALSQINTSRDAARRLVRPNIPRSSGIDPALNQAIRNAQEGVFDASRALAPAKQEIADAYAANQAVNKAVSGGQASEYGARMNKASIDRTRAGMRLPMIQDEIRRNQQARLNSLISTRQGAALDMDRTNMAGARLATEQYLGDLGAVADLGAQGRINFRNSLQTLPDNFLGVAGRLMPVSDPYAQVAAANTARPDNALSSGTLRPYNDYYNQVRRGMVDAFNKQRFGFNPYFSYGLDR